jgi:hypothetical protein
VRNSLRYFVSRLALNLVMKGHEDGGNMFFGMEEALPLVQCPKAKDERRFPPISLERR